MISDARLEQALTFLATTDESCAVLLADVERTEAKAKAVKDTVFLHSAGTIAERTALAGVAKEYAEASALYFSAIEAYRKVANKRQTEEIVVGVWRSLSANRRQG